MSPVTVWQAANGSIKLHQLSNSADAVEGFDKVTVEDGKEIVETENGFEQRPRVVEKLIPRYAPIPYNEQIDYHEMLEPFEGYTCVSTDYTGSAPEVDPSLWRWDGNKIITITPVPKWVSAKQVRILLLRKGLLAQVKQMIAQQDEATQIEWEFSEKYERDNPLLLSLAANIPLDSAQIDQFFIEAAAIP